MPSHCGDSHFVAMVPGTVVIEKANLGFTCGTQIAQ
jgi:hypothetical protein